jgi:hypothetical protein
MFRVALANTGVNVRNVIEVNTGVDVHNVIEVWQIEELTSILN